MAGAPSGDTAGSDGRDPTSTGAASTAAASTETANGSAPAALPLATRANAGGERCSLGDPVRLGTADSRAVDLSIAFGRPDRGLVVWSIDEDHVRARAVGAGNELGAPVETELGHAHGMDVLAPVDDRYLVVSRGAACGRYGGSCFHSRALAADGSAAGPALDEPPDGQENRVGHWLPTPDGVVASQGGRWAPRLARYRVAGDGSTSVELVTRCCIGSSGQGPYDAIAADGDGWIVLGRREDSDEPSLWRSADDRERDIESIPEGSRVLAIAPSGPEVLVILRPTQGRPQLLRLDPRGRRIGRPQRIGDDEPLPAPLDQRIEARLESVRGQLVLRRVDPAERAVGEALDLGPLGPRSATAVAFSGEDFAIAYGAPTTAGEWTLWFRRARCAP